LEIAFNLVNGVDVEETEERIAKFQEEHAQDISDNTKRERAERRLRSAATEAEKETRLKERNALIEAQAKEIRERKEEKEKFLNELVRECVVVDGKGDLPLLTPHSP
jgi:CDK-activating kinase assembly factor MAT1